jgi:hypothetical protein
MMNNFPNVERFVRSRAIKRRNYFHYLEKMLSERIEKEMKDKQPQSISSMHESDRSEHNRINFVDKEGTPKFKIANQFN